MLLRSSSSPPLNSWIAHQSPDHHHYHHNLQQLQHPAVDHHLHQQAKVVSLPHALLPRTTTTRRTRMTTTMLPRALSENNLSHPSPPILKQNSLPPPHDHHQKEDTNVADHEEEDGIKRGWDRKTESINATNSYYRKMLEADPRNSLLLGNYAKFLKEVRPPLIQNFEFITCARFVSCSQLRCELFDQ